MRIAILITVAIVLVVAVFIVPRSCAATKLKWDYSHAFYTKSKSNIVIKINSIKKNFSLIGRIFKASTDQFSTITADVISGDKKVYGNIISISLPTGIIENQHIRVNDYVQLGMSSTKVAVNIRKIFPPEKTPTKKE